MEGEGERIEVGGYRSYHHTHTTPTAPHHTAPHHTIPHPTTLHTCEDNSQI